MRKCPNPIDLKDHEPAFPLALNESLVSVLPPDEAGARIGERHRTGHPPRKLRKSILLMDYPFSFHGQSVRILSHGLLAQS